MGSISEVGSVKRLSEPVTWGSGKGAGCISAPVDPPVLMPGGTALPPSPPRLQLPSNFRARRALRRRSGFEDAASAWTSATRVGLFTQRARTMSVAHLLMLGFGESTRVRRTSTGIAGKIVSSQESDGLRKSRTIFWLSLELFVLVFTERFDLC